MSKLALRRFGDKLQLAGDPEHPLQVLHKQVNLGQLTDDQLKVMDRFCRSLIDTKAPS